MLADSYTNICVPIIIIINITLLLLLYQRTRFTHEPRYTACAHAATASTDAHNNMQFHNYRISIDK